MDKSKFEAVMEDLAAVHRSRASASELDDAIHNMLFKFRPYHAEALTFVEALPSTNDATSKSCRADVLGEVCNGDPQHIDRVLPLLTALSADEQHADVIVSITSALGKLWDPRTIPLLVRWADQEDDDVRLAVARALNGTMVHESNPDGVEALIALTRDRVPKVRDWATFALGNSAAAGPDVDQALLDRVDDEDRDARAEAFMALADRGDGRIVEPLIGVLTSGSLGTLEVRAAAKLADVRFHPALLAMAEWWGDSDRHILKQAIDRCDPNLRARADSEERELVRDVLDALKSQEIGQLDVMIEGAYPESEFVLRRDDNIERSELWAYDDESPLSLDHDFTVRRIVNLATSMVPVDHDADRAGG